MSDKANLLEVIPSRELVFVGPFTDETKAYITLKNTTSNSVCFKVRTTAAKQYFVRPNSGILKPNESTTITVLLQPLVGPPPDAGRHKFMIQSCVAPFEDIVDLEEIWNEVDPTELTFNKLTVTFEDRKHEETSGSARIAQELSQKDEKSKFEEKKNPDKDSNQSKTDENEELKRKVDRLEKLIDVMLKQNFKHQQTNDLHEPSLGTSFSTSQVATMQKSLKSLSNENRELKKRVDRLEQLVEPEKKTRGSRDFIYLPYSWLIIFIFYLFAGLVGVALGFIYLSFTRN